MKEDFLTDVGYEQLTQVAGDASRVYPLSNYTDLDDALNEIGCSISEWKKKWRL